jgi:hypothetical protein
MPVDYGAALSAAVRLLDGLSNRDRTSYMEGDLYRDASLAAEYLASGQHQQATTAAEELAQAGDRGDGPDNPVTPEFLAMIGLTDPTGNGNVWAIGDIDGRELKWTHMGKDGFPELAIVDHESDGAGLVPPVVAASYTEGQFLALAKLLHFPVLSPDA